MNTNGPGKNILLSTLFLAAALLLSPVVSSAQTADGTTATATKVAASSDLSSAIEVAVGDGPTGIAFDGASIWVTNQFSNSVMKVANNGTVLGRYATGKNPIGVASDGASVWVANNADDSVTKFSIEDRKSTRLNSSHSQISYAVFCLKKKNNQMKDH